MGASTKNNRIVNFVVPVFLVLIFALTFVFACLILKETPVGQDVEFVKTDAATGVSLRLEGNSIGILDTTVTDLPRLRNVAGILRSYAVATRANVDSITLTIPYANLSVSGTFVDNLVISRFDPDTGTLYDYASEPDTSEQTVTATVDRAAIYCIRLDYNTQETVEQVQSDVFFLLGKSKRVAQAALVTATSFSDANFRFGIGSYAGGYSSLAPFGQSNAGAVSALNSILNGEDAGGDACLGESLMQSSQEFLTPGNFKAQHIVLFAESGDQSTSPDWVSQMEQGITRCVALGVRVMVVLIGDSVDSISNYWLTRAADQTGGFSYRVSSVSGVLELTKTIASDIYFGFADTDENNSFDAVKLASTDFLPSLNGFSFHNFKSVQNRNGFGFGYSLLSNLYFRDDLPYAANETTVTAGGTSHTAQGYYLSDAFRQRTPLANIPLEDALANIFATEQRVWDDERIQNFYLIPQEKRDALESLGFVVTQNEARHTDGARKNNRYFYDEYLADIYAESLIDAISSESNEMLRAIYRLDILQYDAARIELQSFAKSQQSTLNKLLTNLTQNQPTVLSLADGAHAVTAISMYASIADPASYRVGVYDSNAPLKTSFLSLVRRVSVSQSENSYVRSGNVLSQVGDAVVDATFVLSGKTYADAAVCTFKQI